MKRLYLAALALLVVAGCGVDGAPVRPSLGTTVGVGTNGVHASTSVGAVLGNVNVGVGVGL